MLEKYLCKAVSRITIIEADIGVDTEDMSDLNIIRSVMNNRTFMTPFKDDQTPMKVNYISRVKYWLPSLDFGFFVDEVNSLDREE